MQVKIDPSWQPLLQAEFSKPYFLKLASFVRTEYKNSTVYPPPSRIFYAFEKCKYEDVKVVILGQDPYHGVNQANGLAFSVNENEKVPPSLQNILKEVREDVGETIIKSGNLERWTEQGVLLLNATLTVRAGIPGSHQNKGWELFTDAVVKQLAEKKEHLVFMLWGKYAQNKGQFIDRNKHLVLEAPHPSPYSANTGFFGCRHFSKANEYLKLYKKGDVRW